MSDLPLLLEPAQLAQRLDDPNLLIIDLSAAERYATGHIPGAIHLDPAHLLCGQAPIPNKCPNRDQLSQLFSALGLRPEHQVVVYDDQCGPLAGRMIWTLHIVGHRRCAFLNGHLPGWLAAGYPQETRPNQPTPAPFEAQVDHHLIATREEIQNNLTAPDRVIWDARSAAEYRGDKVVNAQKGGHIPGARWLEWTDCLESLEVPRLKQPAALRELLEARGISADKQVITHCQTHRRSGLTYLVGKVLGYPRLKCYDGSWFEWGNHPDTPVES